MSDSFVLHLSDMPTKRKQLSDKVSFRLGVQNRRRLLPLARAAKKKEGAFYRDCLVKVIDAATNSV